MKTLWSAAYTIHSFDNTISLNSIPGGGGVPLKILGGSVPPGTENHYPISDQNLDFRPYFRPNFAILDPISDQTSKSPTLFQT